MANVQLSGDYLPEKPDTELWQKWQKILTKEQARVYEKLVELLDDGIEEIEDDRLAFTMGMTRNRLFSKVLRALETFGLVNIGDFN